MEWEQWQKAADCFIHVEKNTVHYLCTPVKKKKRIQSIKCSKSGQELPRKPFPYIAKEKCLTLGSRRVEVHIGCDYFYLCNFYKISHLKKLVRTQKIKCKWKVTISTLNNTWLD